MQQPWMSVVVPAYNEEAAIGDTLASLREWLQATARPYEILVVDNASEDGTARAVEPFLDGTRVRIVTNDTNRGKGYSVRRGMLEAHGELRLLCDADCAPSLASLGEMVKASGEDHVVIGSRVAAGAHVDRTQPFSRRLVGWPFIALTRVLMREPAKDVYCGFKLWRAAAAEAVFPLQTLEGWTFDAEVLGLARRLGFRVREVGIVWSDRDNSRLSIREVLLPVVRELLAARRNVRRQARGVAADQAPPAPPEPLLAEPAARAAETQ
jgi:dolichyl-phosphate beta-glucosyltransferase